METRASYIAVGAFALILILGAIIFVLWAGKFTSQGVLVGHYVRVEGSVAGLNVGSNVLFGGIPIGRVTAIRLDPRDPELTRIEVAVRGDAPIRIDSRAVLASKSLLGGAVLDISRGSQNSPRLTADEIPAGPTSWERIATAAPKLGDKTGALLERLDHFLTPQEDAAMIRIIARADRLTSTMSQLSGRFDEVFAHANTAGTKAGEVWTSISGDASEIGKNGERLMKAGETAVQELERAGTSLQRSRDSLNSLLDQNRQAIDDFTSRGYSQLPAVMTGLKLVVRRYTRLWAEIREDPARFLLRDTSNGFEPE